VRLILLGPPGVGKGTQGARLAAEHGIEHISTGEMLRGAVAKGTDVGRQVADLMRRGKLVSDELTVAIVRDRLLAPDVAGGFILDGFPRTVPQAEALETVLCGGGVNLDAAVVFDAPVRTIILRLAGRRVCPKCAATYHVLMDPPKKAVGHCDFDGAELELRHDDREEVVRDRLNVYTHKTAPLIRYYREKGLLRPVSAIGDPDEVFARLEEALERVACLGNGAT